MELTAKVENYLMNQRGTVKHVNVDIGTRACVHCIWYDQYHHQNRGNLSIWVPTCYGYCVKHAQQRGALRKPCKDYETKSTT